MTSSPGLFLNFEGTEGSGKSTQIRILIERLRSLNLPVILNQEPGATRIGKEIRRILLDPAHEEMDSRTELLLMFASRTQAAAEIIRPALERGEIVITDRFTDSTLAYQGHARGLGFHLVAELHRLVLDKLIPDLTVCLALDVEEGLARAHSRNDTRPAESGESRLDAQSLAFHRRVREGYLRIAQQQGGRFRLIDASGPVDAVAGRVWDQVAPLLPNVALLAHDCPK